MWNFTFRSRKTRYIKHLCRADLPLPVQVFSSFFNFALDSFFARIFYAHSYAHLVWICVDLHVDTEVNPKS